MQTPAGRAERGQGGSRIAGTHTEKLIQAYATVNKFLSAFIDHVSTRMWGHVVTRIST